MDRRARKLVERIERRRDERGRTEQGVEKDPLKKVKLVYRERHSPWTIRVFRVNPHLLFKSGGIMDLGPEKFFDLPGAMYFAGQVADYYKGEDIEAEVDYSHAPNQVRLWADRQLSG